ncbi:hypothetical protein E2C01_076292 [Portunus trituberculatus]|uniref:Uncharacterized protein n=1 Tax=Portunus trituberculatus TaxID=210409 RepID=A0A5B7IN82_PORTR|nr:hypothetical protein [Portunus trituberculatus]
MCETFECYASHFRDPLRTCVATEVNLLQQPSESYAKDKHQDWVYRTISSTRKLINGANASYFLQEHTLLPLPRISLAMAATIEKQVKMNSVIHTTTGHSPTNEILRYFTQCHGVEVILMA